MSNGLNDDIIAILEKRVKELEKEKQDLKDVLVWIMVAPVFIAIGYQCLIWLGIIK